MEKMSIGKRSEYQIWAKLLGSGIDVFPSLVDDKGIDGIAGYQGRYYEVQIKSSASWTGQRGITVWKLRGNLDRIVIIYNYAEDELRYFTAKQILKERKWHKTIRYEHWGQIPLSKHLLEKYKGHDFKGLVKFLKR